MDDDFAELRSIVNRPRISDRDWAALGILLWRAHAMNPARYAEQWRPYLQGYIHHFEAYFSQHALPASSIAELETMREVFPFVRASLEVSASSASALREMLAAPAFASVSRLDLQVAGRAKDIFVAISEAKQTAQISALRFSFSRRHDALDQSAGEALADLLALPALRELALSGNTLADIAPLASTEALGKITSLEFDNAITSEQLATLLATPHIRALRDLAITGSTLSLDAVPIADASHLTSLKTLRIESAPRSWTMRHSGIRDQGCLALADAKHLTGLTTLALIRQELTVTGVEALLRSPYLGAITHLELGHNALGNESVEAILESPIASQLTHLGLQMNLLIGEGGVRALAEASADTLASIEALDLSGLMRSVSAETSSLLRENLVEARGCELRVK